MKRLHLAFAIAGILILVACAKHPPNHRVHAWRAGSNTGCRQKNHGIVYGGGNGFSMETAVTILHAKGGTAGVRAEYHWISVHYPNWKVRARHSCGGNMGFTTKLSA